MEVNLLDKNVLTWNLTKYGKIKWFVFDFLLYV